MRKANFKTVIISADLDTLTIEENAARYVEMKSSLVSLQIGFTTAYGSYKGKFENSLIVPVLEDKIKVLRGMAKHFEQDCILVIDEMNTAHLDFLNGQTKTLGIFREVHSEVAKRQENYTYINNKYYMAV